MSFDEALSNAIKNPKDNIINGVVSFPIDLYKSTSFDEALTNAIKKPQRYYYKWCYKFSNRLLQEY